MALDWEQSVRQGEAWEFYIDVTRNGSPATAELTGATLKLHVRRRRSETSATTPIVSLTSPTGITVNTVTGRVSVLVSHTLMASCPTGRPLPYGLLLVEAGGRRRYLADSEVTVVPTTVRE
jgi:DNA-binding beta-propeller fold protein YncE